MPFGRLERSAGLPPMSDINMTPLIDVMLVLLVIFIITAPLLASSIRLDLPRTGAARPNQAGASIVVTLGPDGQAYLQDRPVTLPELAQRLAQARQADAGTELQLRADRRVPYGRIVEVIDAAQQAGLSRIGFASDNLGAAAAAQVVPAPAGPAGHKP